ncbi:MAG: hypothetical protein NTZ59_10230 [Bacteroidetes bacterium]|nr:hypothetical protein [Bacteroidota bacterium]
MINISISWEHSKKGIIIFLLSLVELVFWYIGKSFNVYKFAVTGAVFELLALPMLIGGLAIGILSIFTLITNKQIGNKLFSILALIILIIIYIILA